MIAPAPAAPLLSVQSLSVEYRSSGGAAKAVRDVTFNIGDREAVALIGESGSGKSTIAQAVMCLLPGNAVIRAGSILYREDPGTAGIELVAASPKVVDAFRWESCAMVPQGAINALNPVMRVAEHFTDTAQAHGHPTGTALRTRAFEMLDSVKLDPDRVWTAYPHELSGGMRQRVLIALALLLSPRLLILDEPTTALDVLTQRSIVDVLVDLRRSRAFALLFISHDLQVASELADRVLTMYAGLIVEDGPAQFDGRTRRHPYTSGLWSAVPNLDGDLAGLAPIPGSPPSLIDLPTGCPFHPRCGFAMPICAIDEPSLRPTGVGVRAACHDMVATHG